MLRLCFLVCFLVVTVRMALHQGCCSLLMWQMFVRQKLLLHTEPNGAVVIDKHQKPLTWRWICSKRTLSCAYMSYGVRGHDPSFSCTRVSRAP